MQILESIIIIKILHLKDAMTSYLLNCEYFQDALHNSELTF